MTSIVQNLAGHLVASRTTDVPDFNAAYLNEVFAIERLSTEPLGSMTLTLTNVVTGSRYRIERAGDGSLATPTANAEGTAGSSTVNITLDYFTVGNANNSLKIKVRKGTSAPKYQPFETQTTISVASQSVYVAQIADAIA